MNQDIFRNQWSELRTVLKEWWARLTDNDLADVNGDYDRLIDILSEKYGCTRERAEDDFNRWLTNYRLLNRKQKLHLL